MKSHFTTTQAARLLSVSSDTVLKWVKAGKLASYRTPGGHHRIPAEAVTALLPGDDAAGTSPPDGSDHLHCWDARAHDGGPDPACRDCPAYASRARRCHELRDDPVTFARLELDCDSDCPACEVYRLTRDRRPGVLMVSRSGAWMRRLAEAAAGADLELEVVDSAYACAAALERFRPDFVVLDAALGAARTREIRRHLVADPRLPLPRVVLASRRPRWDETCARDLCGWIRKPFDLDRLEHFLDGHRRPESPGAPVV